MLSQIGIAASVVVALALASIHTIDQGYVGVYYRGGALLSRTSNPGFHWMWPILDSVNSVQVTQQVDEVKNVPCGTSGGVLLEFDRIEVVNQLDPSAVHETVAKFGIDYDKPLIFDKVAHELNQFCSGHTLHEVYVALFDQIDENLANALVSNLQAQAPGLSVLSVRVTKPKIPESIRAAYEETEATKTRFLIEEQRQRVVEKEAETDRKRAVIEAEKEAAISRINSEKLQQEAEATRNVETIRDQSHLAKEKSRADALYYAAVKAAEADKLRLSPEYLELRRIEELGKNTKVYFGPDIPTFVAGLDPSHPRPSD